MKNWESSETFLLGTEKPLAIGRYCPIGHDVFINQIQEELNKQNMEIVNKRYLTAQNGQLMSGEYSIKTDIDGEMRMMLLFQNSYNKMLTATIRGGAEVLICKNGMCSTRGVSFKRKHLGTDALSDVQANITACIANLEVEFQKLILDREEMKEIELSKKVISELVGDMYINESLITETQLSILKKELVGSKFFKENTGWDFYNNVTESLKQNHPNNYMKQHLKVYSYLGDKFNLTSKSGLYETESTLDFSHVPKDAIEFEMITN